MDIKWQIKKETRRIGYNHLIYSKPEQNNCFIDTSTGNGYKTKKERNEKRDKKGNKNRSHDRTRKGAKTWRSVATFLCKVKWICTKVKELAQVLTWHENGRKTEENENQLNETIYFKLSCWGLWRFWMAGTLKPNCTRRTPKKKFNPLPSFFISLFDLFLLGHRLTQVRVFLFVLFCISTPSQPQSARLSTGFLCRSNSPLGGPQRRFCHTYD